MAIYGADPKVNIALLISAAIFTVFLILGTLLIDFRGKRFMKNFLVLLILNVCMIVGEAGAWILDANIKQELLLKLCIMISYGCGSMLIVAYMCCVISFIRERHEISYLPANLLAIFSTAIVILSIVSVFNGWLFFCNEQGVLCDGPLTWVAWMYDLLSLTVAVIVLYCHRKWLDLQEFLCLTVYSLFAVICMLLKDIWYPTPEYLLTTFSLVMIFLLFYRDINSQLLLKEKKLAEDQIAITISQIQPHFICNALSSIGELCIKDPVSAEKVLTCFARYLRTNMDSIRRQLPVRFEDELEHVKTYLWIEKLRFTQNLEITYDIRESDFLIPAISIQPIVENAVQHGMMGKEDVCHIRLSTRKIKDGFEIEIADDGIGFDTTVQKQDGKSHVGIMNVRNRLKMMVNGTLSIQSKPGEGTVVVIRIPENGK